MLGRYFALFLLAYACRAAVCQTCQDTELMTKEEEIELDALMEPTESLMNQLFKDITAQTSGLFWCPKRDAAGLTLATPPLSELLRGHLLKMLDAMRRADARALRLRLTAFTFYVAPSWRAFNETFSFSFD